MRATATNRVHGTEAGYAYHRRHGETACLSCRHAHSQYRRLRTGRDAQRADTASILYLSWPHRSWKPSGDAA